MANANKKIQEGLGLIQEAEKYLKTSFFKWSPDFDSAADKYQKAAVCFKVAKSYERAKDAYIKAAECHEKSGQLFHAGKSLTEAANISCESKNYQETVQLMERSCLLYREYGTPDTACINLVMTAKKIEWTEPLIAKELFEKAADIAENEEKIREAAGHLSNASRLLTKSKKYFEAVVVLKRQVELFEKVENYPAIFNLVLCVVIVHLTEGDAIAAENAYHKAFEYPGFGNSDAAEALESILDAYKNGDDDALKSMTSKPVITCQDIEYARLGKALRAPKGGEEVNIFDEENKSADAPNYKIEINEEELEEGIC